MKKYLFIILSIVFLSSCSENYSNGERIGLITQFSHAGVFWKSWEGHLNLTQTGMNSSMPFDFSIDNDNEPEGLVAKIDSAAKYGWKVKLIYHEVSGYNWFSNRGETDHFITECEVLDRNMTGSIPVPQKESGYTVEDAINGKSQAYPDAFKYDDTTVVRSYIRPKDTIYVVIVPKERLK